MKPSKTNTKRCLLDSIYPLERQRRIDRARQMDREADVELQHGHHRAAEILARRATALRGARQ